MALFVMVLGALLAACSVLVGVLIRDEINTDIKRQNPMNMVILVVIAICLLFAWPIFVHQAHVIVSQQIGS